MRLRTTVNRTPLKKRAALAAMAAAGGAGLGWLYATFLTACAGSCAMGAHPWVVSMGLAAVGAYGAIAATRPQH